MYRTTFHTCVLHLPLTLRKPSPWSVLGLDAHRSIYIFHVGRQGPHRAVGIHASRIGCVIGWAIG